MLAMFSYYQAKCLLYTPRTAVLQPQEKAEPNQLFFQALPPLPAIVKVGEAEGSPGSSIQQITYKKSQMIHFWFFKSTAKTLSAGKLDLCRGSPAPSPLPNPGLPQGTKFTTIVHNILQLHL